MRDIQHSAVKPTVKHVQPWLITSCVSAMMWCLPTLLGVQLPGIGSSGAVAQTVESETIDILLEAEGSLEEGDSTLNDGSLYDEYTFQGQAGDTISITLESLDFDTYLLFVNESDERLAENDDIPSDLIAITRNSWISITLPADGEYRVWVNTYQSWEKGQYRLTVTSGQTEPILSEEALRQSEAIRLLVQGDQQWRISQFQESLESSQAALMIFREIGDRAGEGRALANLGIAYYHLGQYQQAIDHHQHDLAIAREIVDRAGEGRALANLGNAYLNLGQYQQAIDHHQHDLAIAREIVDRAGEGRALGNLGNAYFKLGQYQQAIDLYQQQLTITREIVDRAGEGRALGSLGNAYSKLGQYQQAIDLYQQVLTITREIGDRAGEGATLGNLGNAYDKLGQYQQAIDLYQQFLTIAREIGDRGGEGAALANLGNAYDKLGQYQQAIDLYQQSLAIYQDIEAVVEKGVTAERGIVLANLGRLYGQQDQPQLAIVFLKASVNVRETIRLGTEGLSAESRQSYTNTVAEDYRFLADLLISEGRFHEALQVLELLKTEEIREYTRGTVSNIQTGKLELSAVELEVVGSLNALIQLGLKIDDCENKVQDCTDEQLMAWYSDRTELTREWNTLITTIESDLDTPAPNPRDLITEGVAEVLEAQPNTVLIYPVVLEQRLVLLWATRGGVANAIEVPGVTRSDVNRVAFEFRRLMNQCETSGCTTEDIPEIQAVAQQLYQWLMPKDLETVFQQEGIENLVFALDQQLRYLPVAALHDGNQYLVERYTLSTVTAAWLTPRANPLPVNPSDVSILALGLSEEVPDHSADDDIPYFGPLNHVPLELDAIVDSVDEADDSKGIYPGIDLLNHEFDDQAFYRLKIDGHHILHIATHGMFVPTNLYSSYLMLGTQDDWRIS